MEYNPFATGFVEGFMGQNEKNRANKMQDSDRASADLDKRKKQLQDQFNSELTSVREMLAGTSDEQQRQAIMQMMGIMKKNYTGAVAQELGLADIFGRQIDLAAKTPNPADLAMSQAAIAGQSEGVGLKAKAETLGLPVERFLPSNAPRSSEFERLLSMLPEGERGGYVQGRVETVSKANSYDTKNSEKLGQLDAEYKDALGNAVAQMQADAPRLDAVLQSIADLGADNVGSLKGVWNTPMMSAIKDNPKLEVAANFLNSQAVHDTLAVVQKTVGSVSNAEMETFGRAAVGLDKTFAYNVWAINMARAIAVRKQMEAQFISTYEQQNGTMEGARDAWRAYVNNTNVGSKEQLESLDYDPSRLWNDPTINDYLIPGNTSGIKAPKGDSLPDAGTGGTTPSLGNERVDPGPKMDAPVLGWEEYFK